MPQMHLYVAKDVADEVKRRAEARGVSTSRYLADLVTREVADEWPSGFFEEVIGGWVGEPLDRAPDLPWKEREAFGLLRREPDRGEDAIDGIVSDGREDA